MESTEQVETQETTTTENTAEETSETSEQQENQNQAVNESLKEAFPFWKPEESQVETPEPTEENETTEETEVTGETESVSSENDYTVITAKINDVEEKFDLKDEVQRKKATEYIQKGRFLEQERAKDLQTQAQLNQLAMSLAYQKMFLASQGKMSLEDLQEKPFELFQGKGKDEAEDLQLWNQHNQNARALSSDLIKFSEGYSKSSESFGKMVNDFSAKYKVGDVNKWVNENVAPYSSAVLSFGGVPYPEDTLEMIYFWKNKDSILKQTREEAIKEFAKKKPIKEPIQNKTVIQPSTKTEAEKNVDGVLKQAFKY